MSEAQTAERQDAPDVVQIKADLRRDMVRFEHERDQQVLAGLPFSARMYFDPVLFDRMNAMADRMAESKGMPKHIQGDPIMGLYCIERGWSWGMSPLAVAMGTFKIGDSIGHYGRTIIAAINNSGRLHGSLQFNHFAEKDGRTWEKVTANFREGESKTKKDEHGNPVKYLMPAYTRADEEGLGVVITGHLKGEDAPRTLKFYLKQAWPRNSTLWATDPATQICYTGARRFGSLYMPDIVAGTRMEDDFEPPMRDITPAEARQEAEAAQEQVQETKRSALHVIAQRNAPPKEDRPSAAEAAAEVVKKAGAPHRAAAAAPQQATAPDPVSSGPEAGEPAGGASAGQQSASLFEATIGGVEFRAPEPAAIALENLILDSTAPGLIIDEYAAVLDALPDKLANRILDVVAKVNNERARKHEEAQRQRLAEEADRKLATKKSKERPPEPASEARPAESAEPAAEPAPGGEDDVPPWVSEGDPERDQEPDSGERYELKDELGKVIGTDLKAGDFLGLLQRAIDDAAPENVRRMKIHNRRELQRIVEREGPDWADHARALLP